MRECLTCHILFHVTKLEMKPERTIDVDCLSKKVAAIEFRKFETQCKSKIELLIECGEIDMKRRKGMKYRTLDSECQLNWKTEESRHSLTCCVFHGCHSPQNQ